MAGNTPETIFSRDILGRYMCNTFAEAQLSGPFDAVIIGGGTFGLALAQDLFERSRVTANVQIKPPNYRILVLDGGPLALPEHAQDVPKLQLPTPGNTSSDTATLLDIPAGLRPLNPGNALPATRQELINSGLDKQVIFENWGLAWNSNQATPVRFGGLAYCLGG